MVLMRHTFNVQLNFALKNKIKSSTFDSFMWGGFECAAPLIKRGKRIDILKETKHDLDEYCRTDYRLLKSLGIYTVREGLLLSWVDTGEAYDFSRFESMVQIGVEEGIQQIWDLNHFEYPGDIANPFSEAFVKRFEAYSVEVVRMLRKYIKGTIYIIPINEISFWSWISADVGVWTPFKEGRATEWKKILVRATIASIDAINAIDQDVRFIQADPLSYRTPKDPSDKKAHFLSERFRRDKFESWDMLAGYRFPELGGSPKYLDLLGLNYYITNQSWIVKNEDYDVEKPGSEEYHVIPMPLDDPARLHVEELLDEVYRRYHRPLIITETGSYGDLREPWWSHLLQEITRIRDRSTLPLLGVCAYPIIDRMDWVHFHLTNSGFWDYAEGDDECKRIPHRATIDIVKKYLSLWSFKYMQRPMRMHHDKQQPRLSAEAV